MPDAPAAPATPAPTGSKNPFRASGQLNIAKGAARKIKDIDGKKVADYIGGGATIGLGTYGLGKGLSSGDDDKTPKPKEIESNKQQGKEPSDTVVIGTTDAKQTIDTGIPLKDTELTKKKKSQSTGDFLSNIRNVGKFADSLADKAASASELSRFVFKKTKGGQDGDVAGGGAGGAAGAGAGGGGTGMSFQEAMRIANETKEREMLQNLEGTTPTGLDYLRSAPEVEAQNIVRRQLMEKERNKRKQRVA